MGWKSQAKGSRKQPIDRTFATESRKFRIHSSETKEHWVRSNFPGIFHSLVDYWNGFGHLHTIHPQLSSCFIQNLSLLCSLVADTVLAQKLCRNDVQLVGYLEYKHQMRLHFVLQRFNTSVGQWFWAVPMLATMLHLGSGPLLLWYVFQKDPAHSWLGPVMSCHCRLSCTQWITIVQEYPNLRILSESGAEFSLCNEECASLSQLLVQPIRSTERPTDSSLQRRWLCWLFCAFLILSAS